MNVICISLYSWCYAFAYKFVSQSTDFHMSCVYFNMRPLSAWCHFVDVAFNITINTINIILKFYVFCMNCSLLLFETNEATLRKFKRLIMKICSSSIQPFNQTVLGHIIGNKSARPLSWQKTSVSYKYQNTWRFISAPSFNLLLRQETNGIKRESGPYASVIVHLSLGNTINVCYQYIKVLCHLQKRPILGYIYRVAQKSVNLKHSLVLAVNVQI
jgi:hypothetical protein